ncbi:MAG: hypothetical protein FWH04_04570 [Oscillospiraceae bacterium]|nr:hypothetical protein [Oscillospiraceae bacterium]
MRKKVPQLPYNFTDSEMTALFAAIDKLPENKIEPYLNQIVPTLFRLTYTCNGVRRVKPRCRLVGGAVLSGRKTGRDFRVGARKNGSFSQGGWAYRFPVAQDGH